MRDTGAIHIPNLLFLFLNDTQNYFKKLGRNYFINLNLIFDHLYEDALKTNKIQVYKFLTKF